MNDIHEHAAATGATDQPEQLDRDIDQIRRRISGTVDSLEERLSPTHFVDEAVRVIRLHGAETAANFGTTVKQNPVALLLIGAGVIWLMKGPSNTPAVPRDRFARSGRPDLQDDPYGEAAWGLGEEGRPSLGAKVAGEFSSAAKTVQETASAAASRLGAAAGSVGSAASSVASAAGSVAAGARDALRSTRDALGRVGAATVGTKDSVLQGAHSLREGANGVGNAARQQTLRMKGQAQRVGETLTRLLDEQPFVVGAAGVAIGAAIGGLTPSSRRENELFGGVRDDLVHQAVDVASERLKAVRTSVVDAVSGATEGDDAGGQDRRGSTRQAGPATGDTSGAAWSGYPTAKSAGADPGGSNPDPGQRSPGSATSEPTGWPASGSGQVGSRQGGSSQGGTGSGGSESPAASGNRDAGTGNGSMVTPNKPI